jgi:hypothetical protein
LFKAVEKTLAKRRYSENGASVYERRIVEVYRYRNVSRLRAFNDGAKIAVLN